MRLTGLRMALVVLLIHVVECEYSVDDGIYSLSFLPLSDQLLSGSNMDTVLMKTSHNEHYTCRLPRFSNKLIRSEEEYEGPSVLRILQKLFISQACAYRIEPYWTYELCHGRFLRQYHEERVGKEIHVTEYYLGRYSREQFDEEVAALETSQHSGTARSPPKKRIEMMNMPYHELIMYDGTLCDLTGRPRSTRVHYVCYPTGKHEIYSFREVSTCDYEIIVLSNIICSHPDYRPEESNEQVIQCQPSDKNTATKPLDLLAMETEALKSRTDALFESRKTSRHDLSNKVPIDAASKTSTTDKKQPPPKRWQGNHREPFKPLVDPEVVKEFLLGHRCLHGGTGWWRYEFCYGRYVTQYHQEDNGDKAVIKLGRFDRAQHMDWIKNNPVKQPKAAELRKQISHFYSNGDFCDASGKPRQVEVKLKCKNGSALSAVTLYLLEPRVCEYILGVESPLVCEILALADDHHGLLDMDQLSTNFQAPREVVTFTAEDAVAVSTTTTTTTTTTSSSSASSTVGVGSVHVVHKDDSEDDQGE